MGQGLLIHEVSRSHTTTHRTRYDSSGRVISSSQRPLPDNIQHSQQADIHASGGIRAHNLSRRAAADLRLTLRGYWDRQYGSLRHNIDIFEVLTLCVTKGFTDQWRRVEDLRMCTTSPLLSVARETLRVWRVHIDCVRRVDGSTAGNCRQKLNIKTWKATMYWSSSK